MSDRQADQNGARPPEQQSFAPDWRVVLWSLVAVMVVFYFVDVGRQQQVEVLSYTEFKQEVRSGSVSEVTIRGQEIRGTLNAGSAQQGLDDSSLTGSNEQPGSSAQPTGTPFRTTMPSFDDPDLMPLLEQNNVTVKAESTQAEWWQRLLITMLPWILIIGLIVYFSKQMQERMASGGGMFSFGRSKAKRFSQERPELAMDEIAGSKNAKQDLKEVVDYLSDPERFRSVGADLPRGVLMVGPPGTGKTMMAKAVASEAGVPFFSISGSEFIEMFVGVGASRVRDMFKQAKDESPAIIFIDELDSIGRAREIEEVLAGAAEY